VEIVSHGSTDEMHKVRIVTAPDVRRMEACTRTMVSRVLTCHSPDLERSYGVSIFLVYLAASEGHWLCDSSSWKKNYASHYTRLVMPTCYM
jgi:hypothetical protein